MKIIIDHDGVVFVETSHDIPDDLVIDFVTKEKGGEWLMHLFDQANPMLTDDGKYQYVLKEVK
jgi:hypothetical protein